MIRGTNPSFSKRYSITRDDGTVSIDMGVVPSLVPSALNTHAPTGSELKVSDTVFGLDES